MTSPLLDALIQLHAVAKEVTGRAVVRGENPSPMTRKMDRLRDAVAAVDAVMPRIDDHPPSLVEIVTHFLDPALWAAMMLSREIRTSPPHTVGEVHDRIVAILREALMRMHEEERRRAPTAQPMQQATAKEGT